MTRDRGAQPERVVHDDQTVAKVYFALASAGITGQLAIDAVNQMQNQGILFRERDERPEKAPQGLTEKN